MTCGKPYVYTIYDYAEEGASMALIEAKNHCCSKADQEKIQEDLSKIKDIRLKQMRREKYEPMNQVDLLYYALRGIEQNIWDVKHTDFTESIDARVSADVLLQKEYEIVSKDYSKAIKEAEKEAKRKGPNMILNMTELPLMSWSPEQLEAARKLCTDGVIRNYDMPTILPGDSSSQVKATAWDTAGAVKRLAPDAIIIQGEPVFVNAFIDGYRRNSQCYSPCYKDGKFVQFRKF